MHSAKSSFPHGFWDQTQVLRLAQEALLPAESSTWPNRGSAFWIAFLSQQSVFNDLTAPVSPGGRETRDHDRWKNEPKEAE